MTSFIMSWYRFYVLILVYNFSFTILCRGVPSSANIGDTSMISTDPCILDAVILVAGKDLLAFEKSIQSSLQHFLDVRNYYIVTPNPDEMKAKFTKFPWYTDRIKIVGEDAFPFTWRNVSEVMIKTVEEVGLYPINGKSPFEKTVWGKIGWFLQQLLKLYAGKVLGISNYILLDSDVVWFKDIRFASNCSSAVQSYYYASSSQYHPSYLATLEKISGVGLLDGSVHRSGKHFWFPSLLPRHSSSLKSVTRSVSAMQCVFRSESDTLSPNNPTKMILMR